MCQLLGMNSHTESDFSFPFSTFVRRGGITDKHCDGWGLGYYDEMGSLRTVVDATPAAYSESAEVFCKQPVKTNNMVAHIRLATKGGVNIDNVHPFRREMWGVMWCFAHNGDIPMFGPDTKSLEDAFRQSNMRFTPVGNTDSEAFFCALLNVLSDSFSSPPGRVELRRAIKQFCLRTLSEEGAICNFLLSCGRDMLFAFSWPGSRPGSDVWNGLFYTIRESPNNSIMSSEGERSKMEPLWNEDTRVRTKKSGGLAAILATKPLTCNEEWVEMRKGELLAFERGIVHRDQ